MALRGVLAILFGIIAFVWPLGTLEVLALFVGAFALVDGIFAVVAGIRAHQRESRWWALVLEGVVGILAGLAVLLLPGLAVLAGIFVIAAWAIVSGVLEILAAVRLREQINNEWLLGLSGLASVIFGVLLVIFPGSGALVIAWIIGAYAILFGILMLALAFRLRGHSGGAAAPAAA
jgi:uncharacterized membrane protein HdeD (DUF308 family)